MGKGDRRTRKGKIFRGTYGKSRPRKQKNVEATRANHPQVRIANTASDDN
ncbi:MAG: 30S ribosomal protein THX [Deltaproteobacteria bacterium]|nr:MAG: 30S ribosomal protein THX [Deltaproteobacteria bacterium]